MGATCKLPSGQDFLAIDTVRFHDIYFVKDHSGHDIRINLTFGRNLSIMNFVCIPHSNKYTLRVISKRDLFAVQPFFKQTHYRGVLIK